MTWDEVVHLTLSLTVLCTLGDVVKAAVLHFRVKGVWRRDWERGQGASPISTLHYPQAGPTGPHHHSLIGAGMNHHLLHSCVCVCVHSCRVCVCVCVCVCVHLLYVCVLVFFLINIASIYICTCVHMCVFPCVCVHVHVLTHVYVCMTVYAHLRICMCLYAYAYACVCIRV